MDKETRHMKATDAISAVKTAFNNPPKEITRTVTLSGDDAARYALAEALLWVGLGLDKDQAAQMLLLGGSIQEIQRFSRMMGAAMEKAQGADNGEV